MTRRRAITVFLALGGGATLLALAPTASAGTTGPQIASYSNTKGNMINSRTWGEAFYINLSGKNADDLVDFQCYRGKVDGKKAWADMEYTRISSNKVKAYGAPECAGYTGPIRASASPVCKMPIIRGAIPSMPWVYGPDFTFTGTANA